MTEFMKRLTVRLPNFGSGRSSRRSARWRRDIDLDPLSLSQSHEIPGLASPGMILATLGSLRTFRAVKRPALFAVFDALGIEDAAENVVAHARQVLDAAAADHDDRMLLQVMSFTRDVT